MAACYQTIHQFLLNFAVLSRWYEQDSTFTSQTKLGDILKYFEILDILFNYVHGLIIILLMIS